MEDDLPIPYCYDAVYRANTETFHLLLEDLSATHFELEPPLPPLQPQCEQLVDVLAKIHAYWWDHPRLGLTISKFPTPESEREIILEIAFPAFVDFLGDRLPGQRRKIYEDVMAAWPILTERLTTHTNLTLCHGDAHCWNFMYPRKEPDTVRLIDWEALRVSLGTDDLAYMMALFWYPEHRAQVEQTLLRRYHHHLQSNGVGDYNWDDCWFDYRLSVMRMLFEPVWWWATKHPAFIWWDRLERVILAFQDLDCAELLGSFIR
jgi:thiamine kinase-like enzyme